MYNALYELVIQYNDEAEHIYQHIILILNEHVCKCMNDLVHSHEFIYDGEYFICDDERKKDYYSYTLDDLTNITVECNKDDINILNEILYITDFTSLEQITIPSYLVSDYFVDFILYTKKINVLTIITYPNFTITKKFIDMLLFKDFSKFTLFDKEYTYDKPKKIIKDILKYKKNYKISNNVLSYMKEQLYEYYDISSFQLSHNVKRLANDFAQEKIE